MLVYTLPDGRTLNPGQQFTLDDTNYPANWLSLATAEDLAGLGITATEAPEPEPITTAPPVPTAVTLFQFREVIRQMGHFETVNTALKSEDGFYWQAWEYASDVRRDGALTKAVQTLLSFTEEQVDAVFVAASKLGA